MTKQSIRAEMAGRVRDLPPAYCREADAAICRWVEHSALYREARVEKVEYGDAILVTAVCTPRTLGRVGEFLVEN